MWNCWVKGTIIFWSDIQTILVWRVHNILLRYFVFPSYFFFYQLNMTKTISLHLEEWFNFQITLSAEDLCSVVEAVIQIPWPNMAAANRTAKLPSPCTVTWGLTGSFQFHRPCKVWKKETVSKEVRNELVHGQRKCLLWMHGPQRTKQYSIVVLK